MLRTTRSLSVQKKANCSLSYVIQDLYCFSCQEEKVILLKLRQISPQKHIKRKEDAPAEVEFSANDTKGFAHPGHLAAR